MDRGGGEVVLIARKHVGRAADLHLGDAVPVRAVVARADCVSAGAARDVRRIRAFCPSIAPMLDDQIYVPPGAPLGTSAKARTSNCARVLSGAGFDRLPLSSLRI